MCEAAKLPRAALYSQMKRALAPVLNAGPDFWAYAEMRPQSTVTGLARELARIWREDENGGHYEDAAEAGGEGRAAAVAHGD